MAFLKTFVKALKTIFKGPTATKKKMVKRSTTETRYASAPKTAKKSKRKSNVEEKEDVPLKKKKRSAKTYLKTSTRKSAPNTKKGTEPILEKRTQKGSVPKSQPSKAEPKAKKKAVKPPSKEFYVGEITHYFAKISVVVVKVADHPLLIGDQIHIKGSAEFSQKVESLQVESKDVRFARRGELVGLQVIQPAKPGDKVFKTKK